MHRFPHLLRPWHTVGELRRSQFRVLGAAHAVDNAEQHRLRGEASVYNPTNGDLDHYHLALAGCGYRYKMAMLYFIYHFVL